MKGEPHVAIFSTTFSPTGIEINFKDTSYNKLKEYNLSSS